MTRIASAPLRVVMCCALLAAGAFRASAAPSTATSAPPAATKPAAANPAPTIDPTKYRAAVGELESAVRDRALRRPALRKMAPPVGTLRRADGESQSVNNEQLNRELSRWGKDGRAARQNAETVSRSLKARGAEVERWDKAEYVPADAKAMVDELAKSGQIRVGPTAYQLWLKSVRDWWKNLIDKIDKWFSRSTPNVRPAKLPEIDSRWIKFFFYSTVFSLLAIIAYMVWKALGGRVGRRGARLEDRVLEGEDAELLKLPSDELLARAAGFAGQVNYREAVRHRFIATLVRFDERALWRYNTRRTNREHIALLRENATRAPLAQPLDSLARRFDRVRYGNAEASHRDWLRFDADATELEAMPAARAEFATTGKPAKGARA